MKYIIRSEHYLVRTRFDSDPMPLTKALAELARYREGNGNFRYWLVKVGPRKGITILAHRGR